VVAECKYIKENGVAPGADEIQRIFCMWRRMKNKKREERKSPVKMSIVLLFRKTKTHSETLV
jgi:hypothetical protein